MNQLRVMAMPQGRLESLDILCGFDLFMLEFFQPVFVAFAKHWADISFVPFEKNTTKQ